VHEGEHPAANKDHRRERYRRAIEARPQ